MDFSALIIAVGLVASRLAGPVAAPCVAPLTAPVARPLTVPLALLAAPCVVLHTQTSGIEGRVHQLSGNRMPSPPRRPGDSARRSSAGPGVKATVCIFELTNDSQVTRQGTSPWCEAVHTRLIRQVVTDDKGNFSIPLSPGSYSIFTKKGALFYASRRDERNNISPFNVLPGKMTRVDCSVETDPKMAY